MSVGSDFGNPLRKFKLVFLGEQSGKRFLFLLKVLFDVWVNSVHLLLNFLQLVREKGVGLAEASESLHACGSFWFVSA